MEINPMQRAKLTYGRLLTKYPFDDFEAVVWYTTIKVQKIMHTPRSHMLSDLTLKKRRRNVTYFSPRS